MKYTIEQARKLGGFTQSAMADALCMSDQTYINYEKYKTVFRFDVALKFAELTKISPDDIIFFEGQYQENKK